MRYLEGVAPGWGITAVRVMMAIILIVSGYQKLAGGIGGVAGFFGSAGIPLPGVAAPFIVALELLGGILLLVDRPVHDEPITRRPAREPRACP